MAEEVEQKKGGGYGKYAAVGILVLIAGIGGYLTYSFFMAPLLATDEEVAKVEEAPIPKMPFKVEFPQLPVNVIRDGEMPASMLLFGVTFECANEPTADLIAAYQPRFTDMIIKLHSSKTRAELDDSLAAMESIQRQALQKANAILQRVQEEPDETIEVTAVLHSVFTVQDPP